jgi:hypothetical protein
VNDGRPSQRDASCSTLFRRWSFQWCASQRAADDLGRVAAQAAIGQ